MNWKRLPEESLAVIRERGEGNTKTRRWKHFYYYLCRARRRVERIKMSKKDVEKFAEQLKTDSALAEKLT